MLEEAEDGLGTLIGHMARANPQWKSWTEQTELLIVFPGPQAYISPGWYANPKNVPTWNYLSVHAYGTPRLTEDSDRLNEMVEKLTGEYEKGDRWDTEAGKHNRERMLRAIVGFEIPISRWEAKRKLNQNKTAEDRSGVIQALEDSGDSVSQQVADEMKRPK
jgi:transcriptional regulator